MKRYRRLRKAEKGSDEKAELDTDRHAGHNRHHQIAKEIQNASTVL